MITETRFLNRDNFKSPVVDAVKAWRKMVNRRTKDTKSVKSEVVLARCAMVEVFTYKHNGWRGYAFNTNNGSLFCVSGSSRADMIGQIKAKFDQPY
jgi:hypothetical protein